MKEHLDVKRPFFSIIIPTYNSENTLEYALKSIREQIFDQSEIEILVVDGGSTDRTISIANKYSAKVIKNEKVLPEYAKAIGTEHARGKYIVRMDSDEEFSYTTQLQDKKNFYLKHKDVKVLISNRYIGGRKDICGISAEYMNILGDPFSYFIYKTKKDKCVTYKKNAVCSAGREHIFKFDRTDVLPLADSGTCSYSLDYIREKYPDSFASIEFTCGLYDIVIKDTKLCGCIKGDDIKHNCKSDFNTYLKKLRFRVINNVFYKKESGFSSKENANSRNRMVLFCIYALIIPLPIVDSIRLSIQYRNWTFLLHFIYLYYIIIQILIAYCGVIIGKKSINEKYG